MRGVNPRIRGTFAIFMMISLSFAAPSESKLNISPEKPMVYPGPGLPSLESLGLTSANLFDNGFMKAYLANITTDTGTKRSEANTASSQEQILQCQSEYGFATQSGATACVNYLTALGTQECVAPATANGVNFCYTVNDGITSYISGYNGAQSYCRDVATGAAEVVFKCSGCEPNCLSAGANAAYGNGDLTVLVWGTGKK